MAGVRITDINDDVVSRRTVFGAAGLATAAAVTASSASATGTNGAPTAAPFQYPTTKYPRPPFPRQHQPWPGLARDMMPKPDHGETSYKGSGRLAGRKALITGGDSGMGRAAAIAYAREGADVALGYLPFEEPDAQEVLALIKAEGRIGVGIPGDIRTEAFCKEMVAKAVRELGGLDILVNNAAASRPTPRSWTSPRRISTGR